MDEYDLDQAYEIHGAEDAKKLYGDWAATYDTSFGEAWGYVAPRRIAEIYLATRKTADDAPVLDVGAGTGLVAEALPGLTVDGVDISPEMLAQAEAKGLYRDRILADLTATLPMADGSYDGLISCGTFTHGHVGPECLPELLRVARPGALFVCGTRPAVYDGMGFGSALALLVASGTVTPLTFHEIGIYEGASHDHAADTGLVMVFRKL
ncbi:MAG: class I SAM-dependent methyltransferase [Pseudomonadota bacterium]